MFAFGGLLSRVCALEVCCLECVLFEICCRECVLLEVCCRECVRLEVCCRECALLEVRCQDFVFFDILCEKRVLLEVCYEECVLLLICAFGLLLSRVRGKFMFVTLDFKVLEICCEECVLLELCCQAFLAYCRVVLGQECCRLGYFDEPDVVVINYFDATKGRARQTGCYCLCSLRLMPIPAGVLEVKGFFKEEMLTFFGQPNPSTKAKTLQEKIVFLGHFI